MTDKISNYILDNILYKNEEIVGDKREIMLFGVTRILEDIPKFTVIFILAIVTGLLSEVLIVLAVTVAYKIFVGGAHARTNWGCFVSTSIYFFLPVVVAKYFNITTNILYVMYALSMLTSIYVLKNIAPADTEEVPILNKEKRKLLKRIGTVSIILIYLFTAIFLKDIETKAIILIATILINLMATKPIYRFYKCKYSHESEEFAEFYKNQNDI